MGRRVRDQRLETKTARLALALRPEPYFRSLGTGLHLGYRRRASGGSWVARRRTDKGRYREERVGLADDYGDADGVRVLSYDEASTKAREWARVRDVVDVAGVATNQRYTVADAMTEYLADYRVRGKAVSQTEHIINTKILPSLGTVQLAKLTKQQVRAWRNAIAAAPSMKKGGKPRAVAADENEVKRRRKSSTNRALNVLRAALNFAYEENDRVTTDAAWATVKPFAKVDHAVQRFLTEGEASRLLNAMDDDDFADMVRGALMTGCRYGELCRLKCGDVNAAAKIVTVREAKGGKPRHVYLTDEAVRFFAGLTAGRPKAVHVFLRPDGRGWRKSEQLRPMAAASERARIKPVVNFHVLRHTHGSWLAAKGVPLQVIAKQLGHADIRMTQLHYAHLQPSYVADTVRANLPEIGLKPGKVVAL